MTIIDSLFYTFNNLSWDVLLEYIAKLVAGQLYLKTVQTQISFLLAVFS